MNFKNIPRCEHKTCSCIDKSKGHVACTCDYMCEHSWCTCESKANAELV